MAVTIRQSSAGASDARRAGEAGAGFAVVAAEVRGLAQRSGQASKGIRDLIALSSAQVRESVSLVSVTEKALRAIASEVQDADGLVAQIADSGREQATALSQVNTAVNQMDQMTQQNAAMAEEAAAAVRALGGSAQALRQQLSQFTTSRRGERGRELAA